MNHWINNPREFLRIINHRSNLLMEKAITFWPVSRWKQIYEKCARLENRHDCYYIAIKVLIFLKKNYKKLGIRPKLRVLNGFFMKTSFFRRPWLSYKWRHEGNVMQAVQCKAVSTKVSKKARFDITIYYLLNRGGYLQDFLYSSISFCRRTPSFFKTRS